MFFVAEGEAASGQELWEEDENPDAGGREDTEEDRGGALILGAAGEFMMLRADAVDDRFDSAVDDLDDQHQQQGADQQGPLDAGFSEPQPDGGQQCAEEQFLPESRLGTKCCQESLQRPAKCMDEMVEAAALFAGWPIGVMAHGCHLLGGMSRVKGPNTLLSESQRPQ